jgi:peptidoglycan/xylan/chitin deacetylase (PgdA/CDA1 family)
MRNASKLAVLVVARSTGLFRLSRWLTRSDLRILCYHGGAIADESVYNPKLFMSAQTLEQRMRWLQRKGFNLVPLDNAGDGTASTVPLRTVITFDDGWYSTGSKLLPVLAEMGLPSTLYLCTKHFNEGWPVLAVSVRYVLWKSSRTAVDLAALYPQIDGEQDITTLGARDRLARHIVPLIEQTCANRDEVCAALVQLGRAVGVDDAELQLQSRRFDYMSTEELLAAAGSGCSIELHGHVHEYPAGDPSAFRKDLEQCSEAITSAGLPKPRHYCYPSGSYDAAATVVLSELQVASATTCKPGLVRSRDNALLHYLPRFLDGGNVHPLEFEAELSGFSDLMRRALRLPASATRRICRLFRLTAGGRPHWRANDDPACQEQSGLAGPVRDH